MAVVIDATVTMAWCFDDEATPATDAVLDRLRDEEAVVPGPWPLEVATVLLVAERLGRISEAQTSNFLDLITQLPITVDHALTDTASVLYAARRHSISAYDACYLILAERLGAALATLDRNLAGAGASVGVDLLISP